MSAATLSEMLSDMNNGDLGIFTAGAFYNAQLDWLLLLTEDVSYVSEPIVPNHIEVLWHPNENRIVGIKLWGFGGTDTGREVLSRAKLL